ncbi:MAG: hypothetical protein EOO77_37630 [Oxalobacteraceae bacterium]|nr:MAG: hypothetical protein EOO77_37630 [Oxalobacteraceae bacterium]
MTERIKGGTIERSWLEWTLQMRVWHAVVCRVRIDPYTHLPEVTDHLDWLEADGFTGQVFIDNTPERQRRVPISLTSTELTGQLRFLFSNKDAAMNFKIRWA